MYLLMTSGSRGLGVWEGVGDRVRLGVVQDNVGLSPGTKVGDARDLDPTGDRLPQQGDDVWGGEGRGMKPIMALVLEAQVALLSCNRGFGLLGDGQRPPWGQPVRPI